VPTVDARAYDEWGQAIAGGDWWGGEVFYQAPLYPYFVGVVYTIFGRSLLALHLIQMVIGAGACALAYLAGRRLFSETAGLISGSLLALYAPAIFFDGIMHKEGLALFLFMLVILLLAIARQASNALTFLLAGLAAGLAALTRENLLILLLIVPLWCVIQRSLGPLSVRARGAGVFILGLAIVLLPVAVRNYIVGSTFAVTGSNFGPNFFFGNNPDATGVYEPLIHSRQDPLHEREDAARLAEQQTGRKLTAGEVSSYWFGRGMDFVIHQPVDCLRLTGRKVLLTWNRFEVPDTEDLHLYAEHSWLLGVLRHVMHFGVLATIAVGGILLSVRSPRPPLPLYLLVLGVTASVAIFFVFARYRYPLVAPLVLLAGFGLAEVFAQLRSRTLRRVIVSVVVAAPAAFLINRSMLDENAYRSVAYVNLANLYDRGGREGEAQAAAHRALELYADNALAHYLLGQMLIAADEKAAEEHLLRATALDPQLHVAHVALADVYDKQGRTADAAAQLRAAASLVPGDAGLHLRLARLAMRMDSSDTAAGEFAVAVGLAPQLASQLSEEERALLQRAREADSDVVARAHRTLSAGDYREAIRLYQLAIAQRPDDPTLHYELGAALAAVNDQSAAAEQYEQAIKLAPDFAPAHNALGQLLTAAGSFDAAIDHYRAAIRSQPDMVPARYNLATTLAAAGRVSEALAAMEECAEVARKSAPPDVLARIEDRLTRLRQETNQH